MAARKTKIKHDEKTKEKIRATQLVNFLSSAALRAKKGKPVDANRIAAAKAVLPFLRPALQSVEQTIVDERDKQDPAELEAKLRALYDARPELFAFMQAKAPQQSSDVTTQPKVTH